jgi:hypothetical protein
MSEVLVYLRINAIAKQLKFRSISGSLVEFGPKFSLARPK